MTRMRTFAIWFSLQAIDLFEAKRIEKDQGGQSDLGDSSVRDRKTEPLPLIR